MFQYFPESLNEDQKRFWPVELLVYELEQRGFEVRAEIRTTIQRMSARDALHQAKGRDMSTIAILDEHHFTAGIAQLERDASNDVRVLDRLAIMEVCARLCAS